MIEHKIFLLFKIGNKALYKEETGSNEPMTKILDISVIGISILI